MVVKGMSQILPRVAEDDYFTEFSTKWRLKGIKSEYSLLFHDGDDLSSILLKRIHDTCCIHDN